MDATRRRARSALISSLGRDAYEKLLRSINDYAAGEHPRLRWWQESLFRRLAPNVGVLIADLHTAIDVLLVCHVHGERIAAAKGCLVAGSAPSHSSEYLVAEEQLFPHSQEVDWVQNRKIGRRQTAVLSCSCCVQARKRWAGQLPNNSSKPTPLRGAA